MSDDMKKLIESVTKFSGEPKQKRGDYARGTDNPKKGKGFTDKLVGEAGKIIHKDSDDEELIDDGNVDVGSEEVTPMKEPPKKDLLRSLHEMSKDPALKIKAALEEKFKSFIVNEETNKEEMSRLKKELKKATQNNDESQIDYLKLEIKKLQGEIELRNLNEDVSQVDLNQLEKFADKTFGKIGLDVEFTKHFLDRVNDKRNGKPITSAELTRLFRQEYKQWGKPIANLGPDAQAVMKDLKTDINAPFVLVPDGDELDLVVKTVMRKKNFTTPDKEFPVAEGDSDECKWGCHSRYKSSVEKSEHERECKKNPNAEKYTFGKGYQKVEEDKDPGTYASFNMSKESAEQLHQWAKEQGIENPMPVDELHCTVVYSRKSIPEVESFNDKPINVEGTFTGWEIFGHDGEDLVLLLDCPEAQALNEKFINAGATSDYDEYKCHVTIDKDFAMDETPADVPDFKVKFDRITVEEVVEDDEELNEAPIELDKEDPMNPMVYDNGANSAKLKYRMSRATRQLLDLSMKAQKAERGKDWQQIARLFSELAMNINEIDHGLKELAKVRKKGGINSRGIEDDMRVDEFTKPSGTTPAPTAQSNNTQEKPAEKSKMTPTADMDDNDAEQASNDELIKRVQKDPKLAALLKNL